ncbi:MAG: HepT-like ribonuclease domain-containing protein [Phycisphaerales bacterium]|jgi:uncharacterized protein with HEPN domain
MSRHERLRIQDILDAIVAMRNVIVHQYFGILPDVVWDVIRNELPSLRAQIAQL